MGKQALQAEDGLVEMKQRAIGIGAFVEQRQPRLGDMIGSLGAELRQRQRRHHLVLSFGAVDFRVCVMVAPSGSRERRASPRTLSCRAITVKASLRARLALQHAAPALDFAGAPAYKAANQEGCGAMAGHSKFKNIQFRKGAQDKKRSKLFSKLAREITAAAKMGLPDPAMNARLRTAVQAARAQNMPKDNIERAIKKSQEAGGANYEEVRYEGFGAGGVGVIVEALTDNRNRTASEVRSIFTKFGGNLGETGAVSFNFDKLGAIEFDAGKATR